MVSADLSKWNNAHTNTHMSFAFTHSLHTTQSSCVLDVGQVSDFAAVGWMFWTLESVTGTLPSPGVGALMMGEPARKAAQSGHFKEHMTALPILSMLSPS